MYSYYTKIFATLILLICGVTYALLVPPFQAPDEPAHFARAYGIAEGQYVLRDHPIEFIELMIKEMDNYYDIEEIPILKDIRTKKIDSSAKSVGILRLGEVPKCMV